MISGVHALLGGTTAPLAWWQMSLRAVVVFLFLVLLYRAGDRRIFGKYAGFDIVVGVLLGSTLSRALTGNAPLLPVLAATATLLLLHRLVAYATYHSDRLADAIKGHELPLVRDGRPVLDNLRKTSITAHDLQEALRLHAKTADVTRIKDAYLERNGDISVIER